MSMIQLAERAWLPDPLIRFGIKRLLKKRLLDEGQGDPRFSAARRHDVVMSLSSQPVAVATDLANEQHYELPPAFFEAVLGPQLKYSACLWDEACPGLAEAEEAMLACYAERARLADGLEVLELGCGWGSLSLWMARKFPSMRITAVSNSHGQKLYIERRINELGLKNLHVITADVNYFNADAQFDRILTVEMLEHVRNYAVLFERMGHWLKPDGLVFAHIFCHKTLIYPFEDHGQNDWMARHFFSGGLMPSYDTFTYFQQHLQLQQHWALSGTHYQRTAEAWLENMDRQPDKIKTIMTEAYGKEDATLWQQRWRMFFMACAELFGYRNGAEWLVGHYLWSQKQLRTM